MNILSTIKKIIKRINIADKKTKCLYKKTGYSSNPFDYIQNKTYVWIEQVQDHNHCINNIENKNKKRHS